MAVWKTQGAIVATLQLITRSALLALVVAVVGAVTVVVVLPRVTSGAALTVLTGSMTPHIPVGSVVLVRPVDPGTLQVGDVATYQVRPEDEVFITHRIVEVLEDEDGSRFVFKGDANRGPDLEPIRAEAIRGEVWFHVPYLGAIRDGLHGRGGITLLVMILLAGYAMTQISGGLRERRRIGRIDRGRSSVEIQQTLVRATLTRGEDAPGDLARRWGGLLLECDESTITLLLAPPHDAVEASLELLRDQAASEVEVWSGPSVLIGSSRSVSVHKKEGTSGAPA